MGKKKSPNQNATSRAGELRQDTTRSEGLLWSILRSRQLSGLKFRREHPIVGWYVDFACVEKMLVVEVDGGYHDEIVNEDIEKDKTLRDLGWNVLRYTSEEVEEDAELVARAITAELGLEFELRPRSKTKSGSHWKKE